MNAVPERDGFDDKSQIFYESHKNSGNFSALATRAVILVLLLAPMVTLAQNNSDPIQCMGSPLVNASKNLNRCKLNNTELLMTIADNTAPILGVQPYPAYVYTVFGAFISLFGVGATYCCDTLTSWFYGRRTEKHLSRKIDDLGKTLIDEMRSRSEIAVINSLNRCRAVLVAMLPVRTTNRNIGNARAINLIDSWLAGEPEADDIEALSAMIEAAAKKTENDDVAIDMTGARSDNSPHPRSDSEDN